MNKFTIGFGVAVITVVSVSTIAFAAGANLTGGSIGQRANDASSFGFAVCNSGAAAQTASVPVTVTANGVTVSSQSSPSITAGACVYTYLPYASFNMIGGKSYMVQVAITGASAQSYSVKVPGSVLGASTVNPAVAGPVDQNRINLMATEVQVMKQLISILKTNLGL